jgi:CHAT domain-containing protein/tetratricopeptide (TPR) repeat protein
LSTTRASPGRSPPPRVAGLAIARVAALALLASLPAPPLRAQLVERVEALRAAGEIARALALLESAEIGESPAGPAGGASDRVARARIRHELLVELDRLDEAAAATVAWLQAAAELGPEVELEAARAVALFFQRRGQRTEGARVLAERLDLARGAERSTRLAVELDLANSWIAIGRYPEAEELLDGVEELAREERLHPAQRLELLEAWGNLHYFRLEPRRALATREEAARLAIELGRRDDAVRLFTDLGLTRIQLHDYGAAIADLQRATEQTNELAPHQRLPILHGLGVAAIELHRLDEAERAFIEFTATVEELGNRRLLSVGVGELGLVALERGDTEGALAAFDRAIEHARAVGDLGNEIAWWMNRGLVRRDQRRFAEALESYRRAEELAARLPGRVDAALPKHMGQCWAGLGDDEQALSLFAQALELAERSGNRKVRWETHRELGRLHRRRGERERAEASYLAALDALESLRSGLRIDSFKTDFFEDKVGVYEEAADLFAERADDGAERSFEIAERARARAFLDTLAAAGADLHQTLPEPLLREERRLLDEISRLQAALRRRDPQAADLGERLATTERELEALAARVADELPRYRTMHGLSRSELATSDLAAPRLGTTSRAEVQGALVPGELLVAFLLADHSSFVWALDGDRVELARLGPRSEIEPAVVAAWGELATPNGEPEAAMRALGELLLAPIADRVAAARSLVVVPSGALFYLPFEALAEPGAGAPLGERLPVAYAPSASVLIELRRREPATRPPRALVLTDPATAPPGAPRTTGSAQTTGPAPTRGAPLGAVSQLGRLPFTRREADVIERLFGDQAVLLDGPSATEARLLSEPLSTFSLLHFGTHGVIDATNPSRSALVLSPPAPGDAGSDGFLVPRDIVRLELDADMVTLSACESALGNVVSGEGMVSLARSFFYAGTPAVVASLWSVNDRASAELMSHFYRALATGASRAKALQQAKRTLRAEPRYRHPYHWAGFVLIGDGEGRVEFPPQRAAVSRWAVALVVVVVAVACICVLACRRSRRAFEGT